MMDVEGREKKVIAYEQFGGENDKTNEKADEM